MLKTAEKFLAEMDRLGLKYKEANDLPDGKTVVTVGWEREMTQYDVSLFFFEDGKSLTLRIFRLFTVPVDKRLDILEQMNTFNRDYRWVKFFVDKENRASLQIDAIADEETSGKIPLELMLRTNTIIDSTYPAFMHIIWG